MTTLFELAKVLRSKNSGPFSITIDIFFAAKENYEKVKNSGTINKATIAELYNLAESQIQNIVFYDQALGIKITFLRDTPSGTVGDRDVYGAQQHGPLLNLQID